ncbi:hypothetical protein HYT57_04095 [Candidatus Woesearchaeota archaeon]|nr:hypothetical protein [Candidatus Woesearchaeota archaeon]
MNNKKVEWALRIAVFGTFLGHGVFALLVKQSWIPYFNSVGISNPTAMILLPLIGILDILVAISVLIKPIRGILIWAVFWAFTTALIRPISGEPIWDFIERTANWAAPLALLYLIGFPKKLKDILN